MLRAGILGVAAIVAAAPVAAQDDVASFYTGKQLRIIVGVGVGSGYDTTARIVGRHIGKHIPGKPEVIVQNQPGAGSATMMNTLYASGARDGTVIGAPFNGGPTIPVLAPDQGRFDATKLGWVGSANKATQTIYAWHTAPIKSIEDVFKQEFVVGSQAPGSSQYDYPAVANVLFGTKFKIINGYSATPKIHLAMEAGEVMGVAATSWSTLKFLISDYIKDKKVNLLGQWGLKKHAELPDLPNMLDYAKTDEQKLALRLLLVRLEFGVPYFVPPEVPAARLTALRRAFDATMKDPGYIAENERAKLEINPLTGEEVEALVKEASATPPAIAKIVRDAMAVK